jgi:hypothetical protein
MSEVPQFKQDVEPANTGVDLRLMPTGSEVTAEDPHAMMHTLLRQVVVIDYRVASRQNGRPVQTIVPNAVVHRGESTRPANGIYSAVPLLRIAPEV